MAYSDLEDHQSPVVRLGTSFASAREDRFTDLDQSKPENSAIFNSDGVLFFETGSLAPGVLTGTLKTGSFSAADGASVKGEVWVEPPGTRGAGGVAKP